MENKPVELAEDLPLESISSKETDWQERWLGNALDVENNLQGPTQVLSIPTGGLTLWTPLMEDATSLMLLPGTSLALLK